MVLPKIEKNKTKIRGRYSLLQPRPKPMSNMHRSVAVAVFVVVVAVVTFNEMRSERSVLLTLSLCVHYFVTSKHIVGRTHF